LTKNTQQEPVTRMDSICAPQNHTNLPDKWKIKPWWTSDIHQAMSVWKYESQQKLWQKVIMN